MAKEEVSVTLEIDEQLLKRTEGLFRLLGLDLNTATILFYKAALNYDGLPFRIKAERMSFDEMFYMNGGTISNHDNFEVDYEEEEPYDEEL